MPIEKADYVIVGGGVYGTATAWHLARAGAEVLLLEKRSIASGASGGFGKRGVRANGRDVRELPLMRRAYEVWPSLASELGAPTGWEPVGHLQLYEQQHHSAAAAVRAMVQSAAGIPTSHLDFEGLREIEPGVSDVVIGALHCPLDGVADHAATTDAYAGRALEAGAAIREDALVTSIGLHGGRAVSVELESGERFGVGRELLLLANSGVPDLVRREIDRNLPIWTIFPQALSTAPAPEAPFHSLLGHAHRRLALKMLPNGAVMMSGGWRGSADQGSDRGRTHPDAVAGNYAEAIRIFPAIGDLEIVEARADRAETACIDGIPIIDNLPEAENLWIACAWAGHGWAIAPVVAPLLAEWILDRRVPELLRPFRLDRLQTP